MKSWIYSAMLRDRKSATVNHAHKWPRQQKATNQIILSGAIFY